MFTNYLKIALRNMLRHKGYAIINIAGLAVGMTCCILIMLWVRDELSFDRFHENADRICRMAANVTVGGNCRRVPVVSAPIAPAITESFPEVENAVRISPQSRLSVAWDDHRFFEERVFMADNSIFDVFTFPLLIGDPKTALAAPYTVVVSETVARKYFGDEDPIGKTLVFEGDTEYAVTGVMRDVPGNSHLTFDMLCSFETLYAMNNSNLESWGSFVYYTYVLLAENAEYEALDQKLAGLIDANLGEALRGVGASIELYLQPMKRIHLHSNLEGEIGANGNIAYVYLFSGIAAFILLIACFNFINLTTARSILRAREVGIRKTFGAGKGRLIRQFLGESVAYSILAGILAIILLEMALPIFNSLADRDIVIDYVQSPWLPLALAGLVLVVGFAAGIYPAFSLSSFRPIRMLKENRATGTGQSRFRGALVAVQFVICITLIIGTIIIYKQLHYVKNKNLGFDKEHVVVMAGSGNKPIWSGLPLAAIKAELAGVPGVVRVGVSSIAPGGSYTMLNYQPEGFSADEAQLMSRIDIDADALPVLGVDIVAGRNFSADLTTDTIQSVIINETAARKFGWDDPVGKTIKQRVRGPEGSVSVDRTVIGVVRDFHFNSLHLKIEPMLIGNSLNSVSTLIIKIAPGDISRTLDGLRDTWNRLFPTRPFDYVFLDESFDSQYRADMRLGNIMLYSSLLAIFIGCLGLYGMSSYTAEQRTREIGIRKVLGATVPGIIRLICRNIVFIVVVAGAVAVPITWYVMNRWLENFAYRIDIGISVFLVSVLIALTIALATVGYQSIRAALGNPVKALRHE